MSLKVLDGVQGADGGYVNARLDLVVDSSRRVMSTRTYDVQADRLSITFNVVEHTGGR
jgi:hypothetical protein